MFDQIGANKRRSALLIAAFVALVFIAASALHAIVGLGPVGLVIALLVAVIGSLGSYWKSDAIALAMNHARWADPVEHARLHNIVEGLCIAAGLPKPTLYVIDDEAPNAFAAGRDPRHASVAVTTGLLGKLNRIELEGVLAHELSHIKNYDILVSTLAVTLVGVVALISDFALRYLWAVSRRRESLADVTGVSLTRYPPGLISALEKLRDDSTVVHSASRATAHLWIEAPTAQVKSEGRLAWLDRLFNTHPPLDERIEALREL